ncbi:MAG: hypothetical protein EOM25_05585 [Deltaproteobacteria bacterium]|nr:hypothetical protein [Deltaproteobacteria bacterium]
MIRPNRNSWELGPAEFCVHGLWLFPLLVLLCASCAPKRLALDPGPKTAWDGFSRSRQAVSPLESGDFSIRASMNTASKDRKDRLVIKAWGRMRGPVRTDIEAGIGKTLVMWLDEPGRWTAFYPTDNRAYYHADARVGMNLLGFASPFDVRELLAVSLGRVDALIPDTPGDVANCGAGCWRFFFPENARLASLDLDVQGIPLTMIGRDGWRVDFIRSDGKDIPDRLDLLIDPQTRAVIRVKEFEIRSDPWPDRALELDLPEDARVLRLLDEGEQVLEGRDRSRPED